MKQENKDITLAQAFDIVEVRLFELGDILKDGMNKVFDQEGAAMDWEGICLVNEAITAVLNGRNTIQGIREDVMLRSATARNYVLNLPTSSRRLPDQGVMRVVEPDVKKDQPIDIHTSNNDKVPGSDEQSTEGKKIVTRNEAGEIVLISDVRLGRQVDVSKALIEPNKEGSDFLYPEINDQFTEDIYKDLLDRSSGKDRSQRRSLYKHTAKGYRASMIERLKALEELEMQGKLVPSLIPTNLGGMIGWASEYPVYKGLSFSNFRRVYERDGITYADLLERLNPESGSVIKLDEHVLVKEPNFTEGWDGGKFTLNPEEVFCLSRVLAGEDIRKVEIELGPKTRQAIKRIFIESSKSVKPEYKKVDSLVGLRRVVSILADVSSSVDRRSEFFQKCFDPSQTTQTLLMPLLQAERWKLEMLLEIPELSNV